MDEELIKKDFVFQCLKLDTFIRLMIMNESPRVITSVFIEILKQIADEQEDSEGAKEQLINLIKKEQEHE